MNLPMLSINAAALIIFGMACILFRVKGLIGKPGTALRRFAIDAARKQPTHEVTCEVITATAITNTEKERKPRKLSTKVDIQEEGGTRANVVFIPPPPKVPKKKREATGKPTSSSRKKTSTTINKMSPKEDASALQQLGEPLYIYTDGSVIKTGKEKGTGRYDVFSSDPQIPLINEETKAKTTVNAAHLDALIRGLVIAEAHSSLYHQTIMYTDSKYVYSTLNEWYRKWEESGWKRKGKKTTEIKNRELIQR